MGQDRISVTNQENKICTLCALIMLLSYDMLQYCTYKVLEEQCLRVKSRVVTEAMNLSEDIKVDISHSHVMLQHHRFYWILL
jgi:hypothetical protein